MRTSKGLVAAMLCAGVLLCAPAARAHHSFAAEFDGKNCRDFTGILTKLDWQNPHAYFYVDVKEPDGHVEAWSFQTYALITLRRAGNDRQVFLDNVGKEVFVRGCLAQERQEELRRRRHAEVLGRRHASGRSASGLAGNDMRRLPGFSSRLRQFVRGTAGVRGSARRAAAAANRIHDQGDAAGRPGSSIGRWSS